MSALLLLAALLAGCGSSTQRVPKADLALVDGRPVSRAQLAAVLAQARRQDAVTGRAFPRAGTRPFVALRARAFASLLEDVEIAAAARARGIVVTAPQVDARLAALKREYFRGRDGQYRRALARQGLDDADVRADLRRQLLRQALYERLTARAATQAAKRRTMQAWEDVLCQQTTIVYAAGVNAPRGACP